MLVSHRHRFIFIKTRKTAGTSVEIYLEPFCLPEGAEAGARRVRDAVVTPEGIVGQRSDAGADTVWRQHTSARRVRELLGPETWDSYLKFCTVRHPLDREVSWFWFKLPAFQAEALSQLPFETVRSVFRRRRREVPLPDDAVIYMIDDRFALDLVLRHESLEADLGELCGRLGLPFVPERLGRFLGKHRLRPEPWEAYFDAATRAEALACHARECALFGYR